MLAGPLAGIYHPTGPGRLLFGFSAALAEAERENIRESTLEGLDAAGPQRQPRQPAAGHPPLGPGRWCGFLARLSAATAFGT